jgi:hypothetical protein
MSRNPERVVIGIIIVLILALTPLIAWLVATFGVDDEWYAKYVIRIVTGILVYAAAMYALSGISDDETVEVEGEDPGKLTLNKIMFIIGIIIIGVGWLSDISVYLVNQFHLTLWFEFGGVVFKNTSIPERLIISAFTFVGAFLIKRSFGRAERIEEWPDVTELYEKTKKR